MKGKVLEVLKSVRSDVDFENEVDLMDGGVIDSFDIIGIVGELNGVFEIEISADELEPEYFNTLDSIVELVKSLKE